MTSFDSRAKRRAGNRPGGVAPHELRHTSPRLCTRRPGTERAAAELTGTGSKELTQMHYIEQSALAGQIGCLRSARRCPDAFGPRADQGQRHAA